jgi:hypothetical protein
VKYHFLYLVKIRVFEIRRTEGGRFDRSLVLQLLGGPIDNVTEQLWITMFTEFAFNETWTNTTIIFRTKVA